MSLRTIIECLLFIAWAVLLSTLFPGTEGQTVAAWLQAIFSVAAIAAAIQIGSRQAKHALDISRQQAENAHDTMATAQRLNDRRKQESALAIADAARNRCETIADAFATSDPHFVLSQVYHKSVIDGLVAAISAVPVHEIGNRDAILWFLAVREQVIFFGRAMEIYTDPTLWKSIPESGALSIELDREKIDRVTRDGSERRRQLDNIYTKNALNHFTLINNHFNALRASINSEADANHEGAPISEAA